MFGFPSYYDTPRRYAAPQQSYDPFGFGGGYSRPPHRPQQHTSFRNPYYQYADPRYYQQQEEEDYTPQRVAPQQQVRLDDPYAHLTPAQRHYLQQKQQQQQQQQQREQLLRRQQQQQREQEEEDDEDSEEEEQYHQHKQQQPSRRRGQQSTQHHQGHKQQQQQQQPKQQPKPQPQKKKLVEVDMDKEAARIQRKWRGYNVRKYEIIPKLRAITRIEGEVDQLVATPVNAHILGLNPSEPLPADLDTYYVGRYPRNVLALENDLTAKLISLDGISGASEIIRPRRKGLVTKIEGILSKVDAIKKVYATMTPPANPTPVVSTPAEESHPAPMETTPTPTPSSSTPTQDAVDKKKDTEPQPQEESAESSEPSDADVPMVSGETDSDGHLTSSMGSMDIQDVSDTTLPSASPSVSAAPTITPSSSSTPSATTTTNQTTKIFLPSSPRLPADSRVPSLRQMCFNLCDSLIKQSLVPVRS